MMKVRVLNAETLGKINEVNLDLVPNENNEYIIGRSPKSGLVLDSLDVSRQHGKFFLHDGNYSYSDLGSINGSLVNDKLAEPNEVYMLKSGDVVRIGEFLLVMEEINQNSEEPEALAATVLNMDWQAAMAAIKDRAVKPENEVSRVIAEDAEGVNEVAKPLVSEVPQLLVQQSGESTYIQPPEKAESSEPNVETSAVDKDQAVIPAVDTQSLLHKDDISQPASDVLQEQTPVSGATTETPEIIDQEDWEEDEQKQEESTPVVGTQSSLDEDERDEDEDDISQQASHVSEVEDEVEDEVDENPNSAVNTQLSLDENKVFEETNIETQAVENLDAIANTLEETEKTSQEEEVENSQITINPDIKEASPEVAMFEDTSQEPQETEVSDTSNQTPELPSQALEILSKKYIALMAHDTKKSDLVEFVTQNKDFLSKCLTIATPSISEALFLKTGFATSQKTASVPAGGHQAVASLIGSGDILAVILLKDILPVQSQANEDALLRLCNANQVLVATNLPTAEAILLYVKNKITSF